MADFAHVQPWVQRALREGLSPTAALKVAREAGLSIRTQEWYRVYGQERANLALTAMARDLPLNRRPAASEIGRWTTRRRKGYAYRVQGVLKDRVTGATKNAYITVTYDRLVSRGKAIADAMAGFTDAEDRYPAELLGAFTGGVFEMVPGDFSDDEG